MLTEGRWWSSFLCTMGTRPESIYPLTAIVRLIKSKLSSKTQTRVSPPTLCFIIKSPTDPALQLVALTPPSLPLCPHPVAWVSPPFARSLGAAVARPPNYIICPLLRDKNSPEQIWGHHPEGCPWPTNTAPPVP